MSENVNRLTYANWPLDLANDDVSLGLAALSQVVPSGVVATLTVPSTAAFLQTHHFSIIVGLRDPTTTIPSNRENFRVAVFDATTLTVISRSDSSRTHAVGEIVAPDFTADDARNNPGPMTATGSIPYLALSGNPAELLAGADRTFVVYDSGLPIVRAIQAADIPDLSATYTSATATRTSNTVYAGPATGSAAPPTFRALVAADIPDLSATYATPGSVITYVGAQGFTTLAAVAGVGYLTSVVSAPKWTTARNLAGNSVDGSASVAFANKFIVQGTTDTGLSAAQFLGALGTGLVKNTTSTGVLSIAVAADIPDLSATYSPVAGNASLVTVGTIATGVWSGTAIAVAKGGTGSAFFTVAGPTATRTYTFPDAAATMARTDAGQTFTGVNTFSSGVVGPAGNSGAPAFTFSTATTTGLVDSNVTNTPYGTHTVAFVVAGTYIASIFNGSVYDGLALRNDGAVVWSSTAGAGAFDLILIRPAAATLQLGGDVNGAAISQIIQAANGITGSNVTGGNLTLRPGAGTGTGAISSVILQSPTLGSTGTTAQAQATRLTVNQNGIAQTAGYHEMVEMTAPSAGAADSVRIYAVDNGGGKTQLMALFATGAAQQIAIQP